MKLDRPLGPGAKGGHGPIRYEVVTARPAERVRFRFTGPRGFDGYHEYQVLADGDGAILRHVLSMRTRGWAALAWPLMFRWLHDALIEDSLDAASIALNEPHDPAIWSRSVRLLRWVAQRG
jgi:hypothetical protein